MNTISTYTLNNKKNIKPSFAQDLDKINKKNMTGIKKLFKRVKQRKLLKKIQSFLVEDYFEVAYKFKLKHYKIIELK